VHFRQPRVGESLLVQQSLMRSLIVCPLASVYHSSFAFRGASTGGLGKGLPEVVPAGYEARLVPL